MDKRKELIKELKMFKKKLDVHVDRMIFFGSRTGKKFTADSDIDLIIVSSDFEDKKFRYRPIGFYNKWDLEYPVDFICYTPDEFDKLKNQISIVKEAVNKGIEI